MKIPKAVRTLQFQLSKSDSQVGPGLKDAIRLSIEVLRWVEQNRYANYPHHIPLFKGETQD